MRAQLQLAYMQAFRGQDCEGYAALRWPHTMRYKDKLQYSLQPVEELMHEVARQLACMPCTGHVAISHAAPCSSVQNEEHLPYFTTYLECVHSKNGRIRPLTLFF